MEILIIVVVVIAVFWIIGGIDNNRPVSSWSDEKLSRMLGKLHHAASAQLNAGNYEKSGEHSNKAKEVEEEIERRKQNRIKELGEKQFDFNNTQDFAELAQLMAEKSLNILHRTMHENSCGEEEAKEIVSKKIEALTKKYTDEGLDEEEASEKAMQELLGINS